MVLTHVNFKVPTYRVNPWAPTLHCGGGSCGKLGQIICEIGDEIRQTNQNRQHNPKWTDIL